MRTLRNFVQQWTMDLEIDELSDACEFNFKLFTVNGKALEFSLDGFDRQDYMKFVRIIEALGGKLSDSRAPDTLVLSNPDHLSELSSDRYDIKFVTESVKAQMLLKLENYRIATVANQRPRCPQVEREPRSVEGAMYEIGNNDKFDNEKCETIDSRRNESSKREEFPCGARKIEMELKDCRVLLTRIDDDEILMPTLRVKPIQNIIEHSNNSTKDNSNDPLKIGGPQAKKSKQPEHENIPANTCTTPKTSIGKRKRISTDMEKTVRKEKNNNILSLKKGPSVLPPAFGIQKSQSWLNTFKIPRVEKAEPKKSMETSSTSEPMKIKENKTLLIERNKMTISTPLYMPVNQEAPANDDKSNDDCRSITSEESELSEGGLSGESYTTRQLRELENYQIRSSSSQSPKIIAAEDSSAQVLEKESLQDNTAENESFENKIACTTARVQVYQKKTAQENNEQICNEPHTKKLDVNDDNSEQNCTTPEHSKSADENESISHHSESSASTSDDSASSYSPNNEGNKKQTRRGKKRNRIRWSEEEHEAMIDFLIHNNVIHHALSQKIWKKCLEDRPVFQKCQRTPSALWNRYQQHLRHNYAKYTNDSKALQQFKKLEISRRKIPIIIPWTEHEHYSMIYFLIDTSGIYRASSYKIWEECLQAVPLLQKNRRSVKALYLRYRNVLRYDYARYTDDPEALKQFKEMEVTRPSHD